MSATPMAVLGTGLVTSVGLSAPAACAAIRAKLTNPTETRFVDAAGQWIVGHQVPVGTVRGHARLSLMAAMAIEEALVRVPRSDWPGVPLLVCTSERERPGRTDGLDLEVLDQVQQHLGVRFASDSATLPSGRVGIVAALALARRLVENRKASLVVVAATDSLVTSAALRHYERANRLLTPRNSDGFMPGEGAGAILVGRPTAGTHLYCLGVGFGMERAHIDSGEPLRADGLTEAATAALADAGLDIGAVDFRITDLSGEQYYFKEASLLVSRTLRQRKAQFDLWHPAESIGESGALAGAAALAVCEAACRKGYAAGPRILAHMSNDSGQRAAMVLQFGSA